MGRARAWIRGSLSGSANLLRMFPCRACYSSLGLVSANLSPVSVIQSSGVISSWSPTGRVAGTQQVFEWRSQLSDLSVLGTDCVPPSKLLPVKAGSRSSGHQRAVVPQVPWLGSSLVPSVDTELPRMCFVVGALIFLPAVLALADSGCLDNFATTLA